MLKQWASLLLAFPSAALAQGVRPQYSPPVIWDAANNISFAKIDPPRQSTPGRGFGSGFGGGFGGGIEGGTGGGIGNTPKLRSPSLALRGIHDGIPFEFTMDGSDGSSAIAWNANTRLKYQDKEHVLLSAPQNFWGPNASLVDLTSKQVVKRFEGDDLSISPNGEHAAFRIGPTVWIDNVMVFPAVAAKTKTGQDEKAFHSLALAEAANYNKAINLESAFQWMGNDAVGFRLGWGKTIEQISHGAIQSQSYEYRVAGIEAANPDRLRIEARTETTTLELNSKNTDIFQPASTNPDDVLPFRVNTSATRELKLTNGKMLTIVKDSDPFVVRFIDLDGSSTTVSLPSITWRNEQVKFTGFMPYDTTHVWLLGADENDVRVAGFYDFSFSCYDDAVFGDYSISPDGVHLATASALEINNVFYGINVTLDGRPVYSNQSVSYKIDGSDLRGPASGTTKSGKLSAPLKWTPDGKLEFQVTENWMEAQGRIPGISSKVLDFHIDPQNLAKSITQSGRL